jgi:hypothetical protein
VKRGEDAVAQELAEGLAGYLGDNQAEHHVAGIAVGPGCARRKLTGGLALEQN